MKTLVCVRRCFCVLLASVHIYNNIRTNKHKQTFQGKSKTEEIIPNYTKILCEQLNY